MNKMSCVRHIIGACVVAAVMAWAPQASAGIAQWQGAPGVAGDWTNTANWVGGVVPTDQPYVTNNGIAEVSSTVSNSNYLVVDQGTARINSGGALTVINQGYLGYTAGRAGRLEVNGGSYSNSSSLILGNGAGSTGTVVMSGGSMPLAALTVGNGGNGNFVLSNGTVVVSSWQDYIGGGAGSSGTFTQYGGIYTQSYANASSLYVGGAAGAQGKYVLNGGLVSVATFRLGSAAGGSGELDVNGGTLPGTVWVAAVSGSTGTVVCTGTTNTLTLNCQAQPNGTVSANSSASMTFNNSVITNLGAFYLGNGTNSTGTALQNGGAVYSSIGLGVATNSLGTYTVTNNAFLGLYGGPVVGQNGIGQLLIHGGDVSTLRGGQGFGISTGAGTGTVEMTAGSLTLSGFGFPGGTGPAYFYLKGGTLKSVYLLNRSWGSTIGGQAGLGLCNFIQSGGVMDFTTVTNESFYLAHCLYEISGGSLSVTPPAAAITIVSLPLSNAPVFRVKGSAPAVNIPYFEAKTNMFVLEYVLDKSLAHLTNINFASTSGYRCGHLRMGLDGGVVMSQTNAFTLIQFPGGYSTSYDYLSRPDTNMWAETTAANMSRITLANGYKQASLDMKGTRTASFAAQAKGHVTLANIDTSRASDLFVRLDVTPGAKTVSQLVADMVAAGYTNSVVEASGNYDLKLAIPASCLVDKSIKTPSYFVWDFTDPTTLATNATVTGIAFETRFYGTMISVR